LTGWPPRGFSIFDFRFSISEIAGRAFSANVAALESKQGCPDRSRGRSANRKSKISLDRLGTLSPSNGENRKFSFGQRLLVLLACGCLTGLALEAQTAETPVAGANAATLDFKGIHIDKEKRAVTFPAAINMADGMLEYLIVAETGKTHESLLSTKIAPYDIQVAMLLLGVAPAGKAEEEPPGQLNKEYLKGAPELKGEKVSVFVEWPGHRVRAEDLIWNLEANAVMTSGPWTYNGSELYEGRFLAQVDGSVAALVRDSAALINNPRPGNDDDQIWQVYSKVTPPVGTAVDVTVELEESTGK
jgi:hypothetical protein